MAKYVCKNILIEIGDAAGTVFAPLTQVASIDMPQGSTDEIEVTTLDNDTNVKEFLQGFQDGGEATLEIVFDPAVHYTPADSVWKLFKNGDTRAWRVGLPGGLAFRFKFSGFIKDAGLGSIAPNAALMLAATVRVSGDSDFEAVP